MATDPFTRGVVDAGVLIAYLNREEGRYQKSHELLLDAEEGSTELWAPMVIQVEVSRWSRESDPADPESREKLEAFLDSDWLQVVEVDRRMARIARDIVCQHRSKTVQGATIEICAGQLVSVPRASLFLSLRR